MSTRARRQVVVTVGTDHHPFDRLMSWVDQLVSSATLDAERILVQAVGGRSAHPYAVRRSIPRGELMALMRDADVVVGHGGPGTIMDARSVGRRPVVVPRVARLGEAVDDHQVTFARRLSDLGMIVLAEDPQTFSTEVLRAIDDPGLLALPVFERPQAAGDAVAARVADLVRGLDAAPRPPVTRRLRELWAARDRGG